MKTHFNRSMKYTSGHEPTQLYPLQQPPDVSPMCRRSVAMCRRSVAHLRAQVVRLLDRRPGRGLRLLPGDLALVQIVVGDIQLCLRSAANGSGDRDG